QVTRHQESVLDLQWLEVPDMALEEVEYLSSSMICRLRRVFIEQDHCRKAAHCLSSWPIFMVAGCGHFPCRAQSPDTPEWNTSSRPSEDTQHLAVELADIKATLRGVRQELEEKMKQLADTRHQLYQLVLELQEARHNNMELAATAQAARAPLPELDSLRKKVNLMERLEMEAMGLRQKEKDIDFYAAASDQVRTGDDYSVDTKGHLQEHWIWYWIDKLFEREEENVQLKSKLHHLQLVQDTYQKCLEELWEENMALKTAQGQSVEESAHLRWELEQLSEGKPVPGASRYSHVFLLNKPPSSCFLKLDQEKQSLQGTIQGLPDASLALQESSLQRRELEEENQQLRKQIEDLRVQMEREKQTSQDLETLCEELVEEREQLLRDNKTLKAEKAQEFKDLKKLVHSLRDSSQTSSKARMKGRKTEQKVLLQTVTDTKRKVTMMEWERPQLCRDLEQVKAQAAQAQELEHMKELHRLQEEIEKLAMEVSTLTTAPERVHALEWESQDLLLENQRLQTSLDTLQPEGLERDKQLDIQRGYPRRLSRERAKIAKKGHMCREGPRTKQVENSTLSSQSASHTALTEQDTQLQHQQLVAAHQALQQEHASLGALHEHPTKEHTALLDKYRRHKTLLCRNLELESKALSDSGPGRCSGTQSLGEALPHLEQHRREQHRRELSTFCACELSLLRSSLASVSADARQRLGLPWEQLRCRDLASQNEYLLPLGISLTASSAPVLWHLTALREEFIVRPVTPCLVDRLCDSVVFVGWTDSWRPLVCLQQGCSNRYKDQLQHKAALEQLGTLLTTEQEALQQEQRTSAMAAEENQRLQGELDSFSKKSALFGKDRGPGVTLQNLLFYLLGRCAKASHRKDFCRPQPLALCLSTPRANSLHQQLKREQEDLQMHSKKLQTSLSDTQLQVNCWQAQCDWLRKEQEELQSYNNELQTSLNEMQLEKNRWQARYKGLKGQQEELQMHSKKLQTSLNDTQLDVHYWQARYEGLKQEQEEMYTLTMDMQTDAKQLKTHVKELLTHNKQLQTTLKDRQLELNCWQAQCNWLREEQEELQSYNNELQTSLNEMQLEKNRWQARYKGLKGQQEELQVHSKKLQTSLNDTQLEVNCWQDQCNWLREELQSRDISLTELGNHCQLLSRLKGNLEGENHHLQSQNQSLEEQNQRLLQEDVENKDQHQEEQRQYVDKLNALQRQNETLEEKSMAQRKFHDPAPKKKKHWIGAKALVKLIKLKKGGSRERRKSTSERPSWPLGSSDQASPSTSQPLQSQLEPLQATPCCSKGSEEQDTRRGPKDKAPSPGDPIPKGVAPPRGSLDCTDASADPATKPRPSELGSRACSSSAITTAPPSSTSTSRHPGRTHGENSDDSSCKRSLELQFPTTGSRGRSGPGSLESHRHASSDGSPRGLKGKFLRPGRLHRKPKSSEDLMPSRDTALCPASRCQHPRTHYPQPPGVPATQNGPLHQEASRRGVWPSPRPGGSPGSPEQRMVTLEEFLEELDQAPPT
uniref:Coiled-coil domain containing 88B n=1 Tax=Myotis lucifugus TaxID=59463 RepID=G1Q3B2_MYOLU